MKHSSNSLTVAAIFATALLANLAIAACVYPLRHTDAWATAQTAASVIPIPNAPMELTAAAVRATAIAIQLTTSSPSGSPP